jgi:hypothetical protein
MTENISAEIIVKRSSTQEGASSAAGLPLAEMRMRFLVGMFAVLGGLVLILSNSTRIWSEFQHAHDFVPAQGLRVASYKCTNWNLVMFDDCTVIFTANDGKPSGELRDWRFGPAPKVPVHLLQRQDDPTVVTTDVSLDTLPNRFAFAVFTALIVGFFTLAVSVAGMRAIAAK